MEIKAGTIVVVTDLKVNTVHVISPSEEIGLVLGVHKDGIFLRTPSFRGLHPLQKLVPLCQTKLEGESGERAVCNPEELNNILQDHLAEIFCAIGAQNASLRRQSEWLAQQHVIG